MSVKVFRVAVLLSIHQKIVRSLLKTTSSLVIPCCMARLVEKFISVVSLVKDSSLASAIAIGELTLRGSAIVAETFLSFEIWFTVALLYWIVTTALSGLAVTLERRLSYPT